MYFVFLLASILGLVASTEAYNCNISALVIPLSMLETNQYVFS